MSTDITIEHVIPQLGWKVIKLYPPANILFSKLKSEKEVSRLNQLRHLGALAHALPGIRQARWDYTTAILYYSKELNLYGMQNRFKIGEIEFSSAQSALQCIGLIWNIGHVPGTFSVEKGIRRYLYNSNKKDPASNLNWNFSTNDEVKQIIKKSSEFIRLHDYIGIARVLAVKKLLDFCFDTTDLLYKFTISFGAPFLLEYEDETSDSKQWPKLREAFKTIRHLAYLTLDAPFSGLMWGPTIPSLVDHQIQNESKDLNIFSQRIGEILSPIEKQTYDSLYHNEVARKEAAIVAEHVAAHLSANSNPADIIDNWLENGLYRSLKIGRKPSFQSFNVAANISLRSFFSTPLDSICELEQSLKSKGFIHPAVFEYKAWNSESTIEPDEILIDVFTQATPTITDVGKLIAWFVDQFDNINAKPNDSFEILKKYELVGAYQALITRAIQLTYKNIEVRLEPWPLDKFGIFSNHGLSGTKPGIWAGNSKLDDSITNYLVRDRSRFIAPKYRDQYAELLGIQKIRQHLRKSWKGKEPRQKWLLVLGSLKFCKEGRDLIEYDGGLVRVASRGGSMTWYGLESKRGRGDPLASLNRRLTTIGITANTFRLGKRYAYVELPLKEYAK